jgi:hypothetical protein
MEDLVRFFTLLAGVVLGVVMNSHVSIHIN